VASDDPVFNFVKDKSSDLISDGWKARFDGNLLGIRTESTLSESNDDLNQRAAAPNLTRVRTWETKFSRKLSLKWDARFGWRMDLRQIFQTTDLASQKQDFDEHRVKFDAGVGYEPNAKWRVSLGLNLDNFDRIEQNALRANSTKNEETGSISARIDYKLSPSTTIGQTYNLQARYERFLFATSNNRSRITRRIQTNLFSKIGNNIDLEFIHRWQNLQSGTFDFVNGVRTVFPASTVFTQDLTVRLEWRVRPWLSIRIRENYVIKDDFREATGETVGLTRNLFLYEGFHFETTVLGGLILMADGEYIRSNTRDSYWVATSKLTKEF
jgi:hypothetical protein